MTLKEQLRGLLEENRGTYISGEELARRLYCTRGAVWKAITSLRKDGCVISAVTNRGYCMEDIGDALTEAGIKRCLKFTLPTVSVHDRIGSTNAAAKALAQEGAAEGTLIVAGCQSNGSGRRGRSFYSPHETGIYMSILLRPKLSAQQSVLLTSAAAVAVCLAIEEICSVSAEIKWVNDIYVGGKKAAGILTEAAFSLESGMPEYAVVGIGVNVYEPQGGFPSEIADIVGAVLSERGSGVRNALTARIADNFMQLYERLPDSGYLDEYRKRLMWCGSEIIVLSGADGNVKTPAVMLGVDDNCGLIVRYENGDEGVVSSGEISIRKQEKHGQH